jgi:hypothetical protein
VSLLITPALEVPPIPLEAPFLHLSLLGAYPLPCLPLTELDGLGSTSILQTGQVFALSNHVYRTKEQVESLINGERRQEQKRTSRQSLCIQ